MFKFRRIPFYLGKAGFLKWLPDEVYLKLIFKSVLGRPLNLDHPQTYREKLQWLKLYDRNPEYTTLVDKYKVREYIAEQIGEEYLIPLLGVWDKPEDIDFDALPNQFVLKCNHDSGGLCICKDKSKFDIDAAKEKLRKSLARDYFATGREWPYKNVPHKIICEKYIQDDSTKADSELTDYKFFCFNGNVDCVMVCTERSGGNTKFYYFDENWELLRQYNLAGERAPEGFTLPRPEQLDKMFEIASKLSKGKAHVRVDLYSCSGKIYFGEMTFFSASGFDTDLIDFLDYHWGECLLLPEKR